jgi:hypothetical protein
METTAEQTKPRARSEGLVVQVLSDEVLIYDLERDKAHCLNQTAAIVWKNCDGSSSVSDLAQILSKESGLPADEDVVWLALDQLSRARLLPNTSKPSEGKKSITRREVMRRIGLSAVVAIPLVTSIVAPLTIQAATCIPNGGGCSTGQQCCSGICNLGSCAGGPGADPGGGDKPKSGGGRVGRRQ